jgi:hypothetical protein
VRKRLLILAGIVLAAAVSVPAALEVHAYRQKLARGRLIDQDHCDRIAEGMTQAQVEDILGGPPGDFCTESVLWFEPAYSMASAMEGQGVRFECWSGNEGQIVVAFDGQGVVRRRDFDLGLRFPQPSVAERVRAWLRRLWP